MEQKGSAAMRSFYGPLLLSLGLVERRVVKGERKCHRRAGSKSD
jgi:hypothetical protein